MRIWPEIWVDGGWIGNPNGIATGTYVWHGRRIYSLVGL